MGAHRQQTLVDTKGVGQAAWATDLSVPAEMTFSIVAVKEPHAEPAAGFLCVERDQADGDQGGRGEGEEQLGLDPSRSVKPSTLGIGRARRTTRSARRVGMDGTMAVELDIVPTLSQNSMTTLQPAVDSIRGTMNVSASRRGSGSVAAGAGRAEVELSGGSPELDSVGGAAAASVEGRGGHDPVEQSGSFVLEGDVDMVRVDRRGRVVRGRWREPNSRWREGLSRVELTGSPLGRS